MAETSNKAQRQDSLLSQLDDLYKIAIQEGMYDAAQWLRDRTSR